MEIKKVKNKNEFKEKQNTYQYIMRHLDIYGEPLQWYIGNDKTYNTVVGGCRTFFVIGAALIFLGYSIYQLFTSREGSYVFYDIVFSEIQDENVYYYQDFEIFFFFQTSGRQMMQMDTDFLQAVIKQTKASDEDSSSSSTDSTDITRLRNLNKKRKLQPSSNDPNSNNPTNSDNTGTDTQNEGTNTNNQGNNNDNSNTENQGTNTENQGTNTENQGTNTENQGTNTENQGTNTENQGTNTENQGTNTENQGTNTENQGTNTENQGTNPENQGTNTENQGNDQNLNEPTDPNENGGGENNNEMNTQGSSSEDDVIAKYLFHECDNNYFSEQLGFSNTVTEGLSATYCLNYSELSNEQLNFTLSPLNPLGISSNPLTFTFEQKCKDTVCTNQENQRYNRIIKQIKTLKVFIKSRITNPLDMENPLQSQVNTFTLTQSHLGSTLYFKKNLITTDSSLIPYLVGAKKLEFLSFDYEKENTNSDANTFYLNFALSNTKGYLTRNYEKLDSSLANFLAVFNALEIVGKILTFFFASFSNEIFIFNYILKDRLLKKNKNFFGKNPPKKIKFNSNDNFITNNELKTNEENSNEEKNNLNLNKKNSLLLLNKNSKFTNNNNNNKKKENESIFSNQNFRQNSNTSSLNEINLNEKNKLNENNNNIDNNNFISNIKIKSSETSENFITNTQIYEKKKNNYDDDDFEENKIELNFFKNFWSVVLMSFDKEKSRFNDVEDSIRKIKLIQNIFDSSVYINMFFDIMRIKKIIFNEKQEKLFNSIHFSLNEINDYIKIYQNNKEFLTKEEIIKTKISLSNEKQNKLTTNIFNILNEQMNFKSK